MHVIANRGLKEHSQENTIDAILLARKASYVDGVLIDIRITLDNEIVVFQKDNLESNTLGKGKISKTNYNDIKKVKFTSKIFKNYIPTLKQILEKYKSNKLLILNLHDALSKNELLVDKTLELLKKYPNYNYYIETSSVDILGYLIEKGNDYKYGPRLSQYPSKCINNISFCDVVYNRLLILNYLFYYYQYDLKYEINQS